MMDYNAVLAHVLALLQQEQRIAYRVLKRRLQLDDEILEDLKDDLIYAKKLAVDEEGRVLVWTGGAAMLPRTPPSEPQLGQPAIPQDAHSSYVETSPGRPPAPNAERRQLTVMFCDLVDSTTLASQLDPEDLREVVQAYQATCAEVIQRYGGHIAQYLGDGLLIYFGYPQAHEDDAQRAVRTGLGIVEVMDTLNARLAPHKGVRLAVRLGIHTGLVVVGEIGSTGRQEQLALGDTPNIAARLQGLAAPDTVIISEATTRLIHGYFVCQTLGTQELKGLAHPLLVYRVLQESEAQTRLDVATPRGLTPLVGREEEVALLHRRWDQATTGLGQVVLISGEAGIGKSRLVQVLKEYVTAAPHVRIEWRGSPYHQQSALYPVIDHLHRLLRWHHDALPAEKLRILEAALASTGLALSEAVPLLAALLSLPQPASYPSLPLTPQRQRQRTLDTLLAWLFAEAQRQPVLLVVEDLHWVDPSTLELLSLLMEQGAQARLCLVLTYRPEFHPPWAMAAHLTALTLQRFAPAQVARLATHVAGAKALPPVVLQEVVRQTDGVPLFVEELTKTVLESGLLQEGEERYELSGPLPPLAIPATLHDALMARLDRLATAKMVAQLGATLGRTFAYDLLQAAAPLETATLQAALVQLVEAEVVVQRGVPPQATYTFKHALIQEAAYQSLLRSMRQQYHQRIAQAVVERFPETVETQPEVLAHHYTEAGLHEQALLYWQRAGTRWAGRSAYREAVTCFEQALATLARLPEHRDTLAQAIDLRCDLHDALHPLGEQARLFDHLRAAETLAERLSDDQRLGRVAGYLTIYFSAMGEYDRAIAAGQRALALATTSGAFDVQVVAQTTLGQVYCSGGNFRSGLDVARRAMVLLTGEQRYARFVGMVTLPAVASRAYVAGCLAEMGDFAEGRGVAEEAVRIAEAAEQPFSIAAALLYIGWCSRRQGDTHRAIPALERSLALCQTVNIPRLFPVAASFLSAAYAVAGRAAEALPLLDQTLERVAAGSRVIFHALVLTELSEALLLVGRVDEASALTERLHELSHTLPGRGYQAHAYRLLGEVAMRREPPDIDQAAVHYRQALTLAEELGMRPLQAHCHLGLGTLYAKLRRPEQAQTELSAAIALFQSMAMTFWLPRAEAALAQVE
jgi:class 3 adenylate cyclase/tetratricopeptide (TPR) repeat protein